MSRYSRRRNSRYYDDDRPRNKTKSWTNKVLNNFQGLKNTISNFTRNRRNKTYKNKLYKIHKKMEYTKRKLNSLASQEKIIRDNYNSDEKLDKYKSDYHSRKNHHYNDNSFF